MKSLKNVQVKTHICCVLPVYLVSFLLRRGFVLCCSFVVVAARNSSCLRLTLSFFCFSRLILSDNEMWRWQVYLHVYVCSCVCKRWYSISKGKPYLVFNVDFALVVAKTRTMLVGGVRSRKQRKSLLSSKYSCCTQVERRASDDDIVCWCCVVGSYAVRELQ